CFIHGTEYNVSAKTIYLQGAENFDTDEYDAHVVLHEWSHYFQQEFSRTDTLAGQHIPGDIVDPRLAFDEGFATALSSILLNNPLWVNTDGAHQQCWMGCFSQNLGNDNISNPGFFNEESVQVLLWDLLNKAGLNLN